jgi:nucleotide-binding universal stress UspA family protein
MWYEYLHQAKRRGKEDAAKDAEKSGLALRMQAIHLPPMIDLKVSGFRISLWIILGVGALTGFLAGFLGVGGGFIRMPALLYLVGSPTKVAVGTDLFEVMFSGAYGAFSYAMKSRVELLAAIIMLLGAAIGAQIGATATAYARSAVIRLYFALTMICAGISVIFKHVAEGHKEVYASALNAWARAASGLSDRVEIAAWLQGNGAAVKAWIALQPDAVREAHALAKAWSSYSGYLMLGSACALSAVIMFWLVRGVLRERADARTVEATLPAVGIGEVVIAASCQRADLPAIRMGALLGRALSKDAVLFVCEEQGVCEDSIREGRQILAEHGMAPRVEFAAGSPYKEILARSAGARLLVIGARPLDPWEPKFHLGDNATRIVRRMGTSTLVVRQREQVRSILLCLDVPYSRATIEMAKAVALATGATVEILYVASLPTLLAVEMPSLVQEGFLAEFYAGELEMLGKAKDELLRAGVGAVSVKLREGIVEEEIIRESVEGNFDLIVLKEGYLKTPFGIFLGRLSTIVATHSPQASVLIVKR